MIRHCALSMRGAAMQRKYDTSQRVPATRQSHCIPEVCACGAAAYVVASLCERTVRHCFTNLRCDTATRDLRARKSAVQTEQQRYYTVKCDDIISGNHIISEDYAIIWFRSVFNCRRVGPCG